MPTRADDAPLRRWAGIVAVAVLVAAGCVAAGIWQWNRHEQRSQAAAVVEANYGAPPAALEDVLGPDGVADDDLWHPVRVRGTYVGESVLLRNRPVDGTAALHVLAGLEVADGSHAGSVLLVTRGWVPVTSDGTPGEVPGLPTGERDVVVRLRAPEAPSDRDAPAGQVQAAAPAQVAQVAGWDAPPLDALGVLAAEDGERPAGLAPIPRPDTSLGSHLSYTFQWWVFAIGALGGAVVLIRRDRAADRLAAGEEAPAPRPARRRRPTAEEEEDAILDRQAGVRG